MSDQPLSDLLDRSVESVPISEPPVADLLRQGRAVRRRRRGAAVVAAVVASLVVVGTVAVGERLTQGAPQPANHSVSLPEPPAGMKWVGVGRTVVAVPRAWPVISGIYCQGPVEHYATILKWRVAVGCAPGRASRVGHQIPTFVEIESSGSGHFIARVDGSAGSSSSGGLTQHLLDASRATLPKGWLAVPSGEPYGGVGVPTLTSEIAALRAAGFQVVRRHADPDGRWRPVTTYPEVGTPARLGSTIVVYDHGAEASSATLRGRLEWVGGPAPGSPVPHPGMIHVVNADDSVDQTAQAHGDGTWEIYLPPGTYRVRATSPGFGSAAGTPDGCSAARDRVTVHADETLTVNVYCQRH